MPKPIGFFDGIPVYASARGVEWEGWHPLALNADWVDEIHDFVYEGD